MFDKQQQFFPTPDYVAEKMWSAAKRSRQYRDSNHFQRVCDTSAGSGAILKYCRKAYRYRDIEWCAIEIDPDLRCILNENDFRVIGTDFLLYEEMAKFDLILINPPFNRGAEHILKSWDMVEDGGCLVALCNSQTIHNPDKKWKRLGELIEAYGYTEDLGQCFKNADRPCDVEVSMIFLDKPERVIDPQTFQFAGEFTQSIDDVKAAAFGENPLAHVDVIDNLLIQYRSCLSILKARHQAHSELLFHLGTIPGREHCADMDQSTLNVRIGSLTEQVWELKEQFWNAVFKLSRMNEVQTSHFAGIFRDFVKSQRDMEFSRTNILEILAAFFSNKEQIMLDSLVSVFDRATAFHPENKVHLEGWKTNSGWKVNRRIIVPYGMRWCKIFKHFNMTFDSDGPGSFVKDLDEVCCWITGEDPRSSDYTMMGTMMNRMREREPGVWHELKYFRIKWFIKGTLWVEWRDQYLLDDFNMMAAMEKKWIGGEGF
jgi:16S rRNA G966 N2-methylase RsmD